MFVVNTTSATASTSSDAGPTISPRKRVPSSRRRNPGVPDVSFALVGNVGDYFFVVGGVFVPVGGVVGSGVTGRFAGVFAAGALTGAGEFGKDWSRMDFGCRVR